MNKQQLQITIININVELQSVWSKIKEVSNPTELQMLYEEAADLEASLEELEDDLVKLNEL